MPNTWLYWNGRSWVGFGAQSGGSSGWFEGFISGLAGDTGKPGIQAGGVWDNRNRWATAVDDFFWDGETWTDKLPKPVYYPSLVNFKGDIRDGRRRVVELPHGVKIDDFVVSVCAASGAEPKVQNPVNRLTVSKQLTSGGWVSAVMFRLDGTTDLYNSNSVVWDVPSGGPSTVANYVYRGADVTKSVITSERSITEHTGVTQGRMTAPSANTALFMIVVRGRDLAGVKFPGTVNTHGSATDDRPGEDQWRILAGDMYLKGGDTVGTAVFGPAAVQSAAVVAIRIPGGVKGRVPDFLPGVQPAVRPDDIPPVPDEKPDHVVDVKPTPDHETPVSPPEPKVWILGDQTDSILGRTTILQ